LIAAYSSYLTKSDSIINIEALKDSVILDCNFDDFRARTDGSLSWERFNRKLSDLLFIQREIREFELLTLDATERYKKFLEKFESIEEELNDYHIASYLGITPVSFSRIRKKNKAFPKSI
jgi:CRP-like cAMP-binding protein